MGLVQLRSFGSIGGADSTDVPTEFVLLKAGINPCEGGDLIFDDAAAKSVMSRYTARGLDLTADYEHQSIQRPPIEAPASAKRWVPEVRNGELVASSIAWTPRAARMIADGEYRYWSIACLVDAKTKRVQEILNFGLTNLPAANHLTPLKAASIPSGALRQENDMKTVLVALGLSAELEESAAVVEASRLADFKRDVLALTSKTTIGDAIGALTAMKSAHEQVTALSAQLAKLEGEKAQAEIKSLLDAASIERKVAPAKRAELETFASKHGLDALRVCLSMMAPLTEAPAAAQEAPVGVDDSDATAEEYAVAKAFCGDDPVAIAKRITETRAVNALYAKRKA